MRLLPLTIAFLAFVTASTGCARGDKPSTATKAAAKVEVPTVRIYRHTAWGGPPKGVDGDGIRRNLGVGQSVTFKDVTVSVTKMVAAEGDGAKDESTLVLKKEPASETRTVKEGDAFNWNGYHIAVVAIYAKPGDLGFGNTVLEVATVDSLPERVANSTTAGGPENRLRVKHTVDKLTLHHSATPHKPGDDLAKKLTNMQKWGESDRNWWDLPYHFMIDTDGMVFEARDYRYVGDTNTQYDPTGHFLINCFGNYSEVEPNEAQLQTIANLMAWAAMEHNIEPLEIFGHKDLAQTSCPGDHLYKYIADGSLEKMVQDVMAKGKPKLVWLDEKPAAK